MATLYTVIFPLISPLISCVRFILTYRSLQDHDDIIIIRGTVPVPCTVVAKGVPYRYAVYTEKTTGDSPEMSPLEDLHSDQFDCHYLQINNPNPQG